MLFGAVLVSATIAPVVAAERGFVTRDGSALVDSATRQPVWLRGAGAVLRVDDAVDDALFREVAALGLNHVRLLLNAREFFETPPAGAPAPTVRTSALDGLARHVDSANRVGLRVILKVGGVEGAQFVPAIDAAYDYSIWSDRSKRDRLLVLWEAVAKRFASETAVAAFSPFIEPVTEGPVQQWHEFAAELQRAIRRHAPRHLILLEAASGEHRTRRELSGVELDPGRAYPPPLDDNVGFEFYAFDLDDYTHQLAPWRPEPDIRRERVYPDVHRIVRVTEETGAARAFVFDRYLLAHHIDRHLRWAQAQNRPLMVWGFGTAGRTFEAGRGGERWLADMVALLNERRLHWGYWRFDRGYFGIRGRAATDLLRPAG
jgi:Cellulase (glycosyl hydrolase family 5)